MSTGAKILRMGEPGPRATATVNRTLRTVILRLDHGRRRKTVMLDPLEARLLAADLKAAAEAAERGAR